MSAEQDPRGRPTTATRLRVEVYSDVVCPWCYIGKRRFERALADFDGEVEVVYRPFQLDPTAPRVPTPVVDAYARKFGSRALPIIDHVTEVAAAEGLEFHLDVAQRANTLDAHRVLDLALATGGPELQGAVKERLLHAYFTEGLDVGDPATLAGLAGEAGLDPGAVEALLASDDGLDELREELAAAPDRGVTAVPTYVFEGVWALPGAQDPGVFAQVLRRVRDRLTG